jgi:hypothetical protein
MSDITKATIILFMTGFISGYIVCRIKLWGMKHCEICKLDLNHWKSE